MTNRHALAHLIDSVEQANRWSDTDVVNRAGERGHTLSKQTISRYRNEDPLISIKGSVILALADGLGVTPTQIATAALSAMNVPLHATGDADAEVAIRRDVSLSEDVRGMLLAVIRQFRDSRRKQHASTSQTAPAGNQEADGEAGDPRTPTTDAARRRNVTDFIPRKQGPTPAPNFGDPSELAAARIEPGYTKSGKREEPSDDSQSTE